MRICVFGAGAIGGHVAARLAQGGAEVSVVARGAQLAAIAADGLRVDGPGIDLHARVRASADPAVLGVQDAVIVTVKAPALPDVAAAIGPLLGPDTPVAFVMNGIPWWYFHAQGETQLPAVDPGGAIWRAVTPQRAIGGVVYSACTVTAPGVIHVEHERNRIILGEPDGALSPRVQALAAALAAGGFVMEVSPRIRDAVWRKLLLNICTGPLAILTGVPSGVFLQDEALRGAAIRVLEEGAAIAEAMGCAADIDVPGLIAGLSGTMHLPSVLQDLQLGRPMEIAALYATPLAFAQARGVPAPTFGLLTALAQVRARAAGLY